MKLRRNFFIMVLVLCMIATSNVYAMGNENFDVKKASEYQTRWANVMNIRTSVSGSSSDINVNAGISTKHKNISGTLYLLKYKSGHWSSVKSWTVKGKGFVKLSKNYNGGSGKYRAKLSINVEGEYITTYSSEKHIN